MKMNNISVIIPIHLFNEDVEKRLDIALKSISEQKDISKDEHKVPVILVYPSSVEKSEEFTKFIKSISYNDIEIKQIINKGDTNYQSQVNLGVANCDTTYFSILEFDDELNNTFFKNAYRYIEKRKDVHVFLPVIVETNEAGQALKLTNEMVWSKHFAGDNGELGVLNSKGLEQYTDFKVVGAIFNKEEFISAGMYKTKIKLAFNYELLLRLVNNGCVIYTIPKIGVKHAIQRPGSLFDELSKTMPETERMFWFKTAKKECNFFNDREIDTSLILPQEN